MESNRKSFIITSSVPRESDLEEDNIEIPDLADILFRSEPKVIRYPIFFFPDDFYERYFGFLRVKYPKDWPFISSNFLRKLKGDENYKEFKCKKKEHNVPAKLKCEECMIKYILILIFFFFYFILIFFFFFFFYLIYF